MPTTRNGPATARGVEPITIPAETPVEKWAVWPVNWSAVWVGTLAAVAAVVLFGLIGVAVGAHLLGPEHRVVDYKKVGFGAMAFSVFAAFLSFVIGGWVAGKIAGILRSETAMLHGGIVWLLAVPALVLIASLGAGSAIGAWHAGVVSNPTGASSTPFDRPEQPTIGATEEDWAQYRKERAEYRDKVEQWQKDTPKATRNAALGTLTALLLGLMGSVLGGWMASGEPMTFTHPRHRTVVE